VQKIRQDISIGENIRKLRDGAGYTQEETVAKMQVLGCSLSRSTYSQIECGTYNVRVSELIALKQIFRLSSFDPFFMELFLPEI